MPWGATTTRSGRTIRRNGSAVARTGAAPPGDPGRGSEPWTWVRPPTSTTRMPPKAAAPRHAGVLTAASCGALRRQRRLMAKHHHNRDFAATELLTTPDSGKGLVPAKGLRTADTVEEAGRQRRADAASHAAIRPGRR